ncbi:AzlC family ABC transporter permease [Aquihabitans sp. G128]|uniref:AzlC family ABC transporter permease n=1 Tax=Aquihabitans sp. G128 TaxID=2849779 RepID=UPI001C23CDA5|nr:AzlC family ABC transporter permease [Aquihabitans sp. G128]QXC59713.1 AzlC family ABC transporter permease [Aquihabitans sp. G128]
MPDATPPPPVDGAPVGPPPDPLVGSLVLGLAVGLFGISFGVLAVASGLTAAQACAMSLLVFTGASQFAVVGVIGSGGSTAAALGSALLLAARNAAYGLAMSDVIRGRLPTRLLGAQLVIDESTAMASAQRTPADRRRGFWLAGASVFVFWNLGTLLGALGGDAIGNPETYGLDAAFPAGFVALVVPHLAKFEGRVVAAAGVALALVLVPVAPVGVPVLAAALAVLLGLRHPGTAPADGQRAASA